MLDTQSLLTNARRFVAMHAERLGVSLLQLREQLRDAIAHRVATAVADAVQCVAHRVLGQGSGAPPIPGSPQKANQLSEERTHLLNHPTQQRLLQGNDPYEDDWPEDDDPTYTEPEQPAKRVGSRAILTAVAIAAVCSMLSWLGLEPLARSVRGLASLTHLLEAGAGFLAV